MKISELIKRLQYFQNKYGDCEVVVTTFAGDAEIRNIWPITRPIEIDKQLLLRPGTTLYIETEDFYF